MKLAVFAYSRQGCQTARRVMAHFTGHEIRGYTMERFGESGFAPICRPSKPFYGSLFAEADALIAAQNAVAAAHALGLGSCYIGDITENYEYHKKLLNLPLYVVPAAMLCFGYPTEQQLRRPKPPRHPVEALVHENGYCLEKSAKMPEMLGSQQEKTGEELADYIRRFCQRKWNSDFSREMSRSCTEMVRSWCER